MITGNQLHAARVLAGLTREAAAKIAGIDADALAAFEDTGGTGVVGPQVEAVRSALSLAGIEFVDGSTPGVLLRPVASPGSVPVDCLNAENDV